MTTYNTLFKGLKHRVSALVIEMERFCVNYQILFLLLTENLITLIFNYLLFLSLFIKEKRVFLYKPG